MRTPKPPQRKLQPPAHAAPCLWVQGTNQTLENFSDNVRGDFAEVISLDAVKGYLPYCYTTQSPLTRWILKPSLASITLGPIMPAERSGSLGRSTLDLYHLKIVSQMIGALSRAPRGNSLSVAQSRLALITGSQWAGR